ncbi:MAG: ATP-dependent zinc protease [Phycisphaerales bacterium]|nr:MAG: ATP-dependent zinc protease [Phycisphaerales bacterium]
MKRVRGNVIGWREIVSLPEWGVEGIEAKIDTGARISAVHVEDAARLKGGRVRFHLVTSSRRPFRHVPITADLVRTTRVRSSTGHTQERYVVETTIRLGSIERRIEVGLVRRDKMLCRMLLGRKALEGVFVIDPGRRYVQGRRAPAASASPTTVPPDGDGRPPGDPGTATKAAKAGGA